MRSDLPTLIVALPILLALASCAAVPANPGPAAQATASGAATVLAVRPIVAVGGDGGGDGGGWRAALLNGASGPAGAVQPTAAAEFIIREDTGATRSIVQSNAAGLHAGDRVVIGHATGRPVLLRLL